MQISLSPLIYYFLLTASSFSGSLETHLGVYSFERHLWLLTFRCVSFSAEQTGNLFSHIFIYFNTFCLFRHTYTVSSLTPCVCVDVLLAGDEQAGVEGWEDKAVVARLPGELDAGGVGDAGNGDAVAVLGGRTEWLGHLLSAHAPVGGHEGHATQEERHHRLDEGEARGTHLLQERHHAGD